MDKAQVLAPPVEVIPYKAPLEATELEKKPLLALPRKLLFIFIAVVTTPLFIMPCI
jgi:hypothetical protein